MLINTKKGFTACSISSRRTLPSRQPTNIINSGESTMATLTMTYPAYVTYDSTMKLLPNEYHTGNGTDSCRSYVNLTDHYRNSNVVATSSNSARNGNPFNNSSNSNSSCLSDNKSSYFINCNDYRSHSAEAALFRPSSNRLRQCYNRQGSRSFEQLSSATSTTTNNQNNDNNKNNDIFIRERKRESENPALSSTLANAQTNNKNQQPTKKKLPHNVTFIKNLNELKMCGFYYENINRDDSKKLLRSERPGTFLLRDSSSNSSYFTLSYVNQVNDVKHLRIEYSMGQFYFYTESSTPLTSTRKSDTVLGLVELYSHKKSSTITKTNGVTTTLDSTNTDNDNISRTDVITSEGDDISRNHNTILKKPYKVSPQTLKEICRITINRENLTDNINNNNCIDERLNSYLRLYPYKL